MTNARGSALLATTEAASWTTQRAQRGPVWPPLIGSPELLEGVVSRARKLAADSEREDVASEVRELGGRSGLSKQDFAERISTSRTRLSTYMSGKVVPSAALMVRMRRVALHASETATHDADQT
jgi:DNA-binding transcriptional regulator YiaG